MATLTNQLHTVGIYITTRHGSIRPKSGPLSGALHYPNQAPPRPPSAPSIARERAFGPWIQADGTMAAAKDSPTTIRPPPLRAGIRTQWSRRRCPPRSLARGSHRPTRQTSPGTVSPVDASFLPDPPQDACVPIAQFVERRTRARTAA